MAIKDDITRNTPVDNTVEDACNDARVAGTGDDGADRHEAGLQKSDVPNEGKGLALQDIRMQLVKHADELQLANGAVNVCVQALLQQNADLDADIAHVLQRIVGDKLFETVERLELVALAIEYEEELTQGEGVVETAH